MERRAERNGSSGTAAAVRSGTVVDAKTSLALWLRAGRCHKGLSLDEVARKTKIQTRILEQLEAGKLEGLPADVFVRGFIRSVAKCVGLDEDEALRRYGAIGLPSAPVAARALIDSMSELAPNAAQAVPRVLRAEPIGADTATSDLAFGSMTDLVAEPAAAPAIQPAETFMMPASGTLDPVAVETPATGDAVVVADPEVPAAKSAKGGKSKASRRGSKTRGGKRKSMATGTPFEPTPIVPDMIVAPPPAGLVEAIAVEQSVVVADVVVAPVEPVVEAPVVAEAAAPVETLATIETSASVEATVTAPATAIDWSQPLTPASELTSSAIEVVDASDATASSGTWSPKMPTVVPSSTPPWRRPSMAVAAPVVPSLVIDDSDPESAERELEDRAAAKDDAPRRSFLPPILRDLQGLRDDRSERQGGLTLAVIILLIAATLTLSYLMRRPSSTGDGVTQTEIPAQTYVG